MGRQKKARKSDSELYGYMSQMVVPGFILQDFVVSDIDEHKDRWVVELQEKEDRIPIELQQERDVVLDGFNHPIEILSHSFSLKPVYLRVFRRRWKKSTSDQHFSNQYDLTIKGIKMVPELGIFLKEED
jgi:hypothetical protein